MKKQLYKKKAHINLMKHFPGHNDYPVKHEEMLYDHDVVCKFDPLCYNQGMIAP